MDSQFLRRRIGPIGALIVLAMAVVIAVIFLTRQSAKLAQTAEEEQVAEAESDAGFEEEEEEGKSRDGLVRPEVIAMPPGSPVKVPQAVVTGFTPSTRVGFFVDNEWEPAIAADRFGHVYIIETQYDGVPGCADCASPTMVLQISNDHGATWSAPAPFRPSGGIGQQWDPQIEVDPVDGQTVYASWMENGKSEIMVGKSTDFGQTWTAVRADDLNAAADKPILTVRGQDVYVAYNRSNAIFFSSSHNGGQTWTSVKVTTGSRGWSLPAGAAVLSDGTVFYSWNGYKKSGSATGDVNLYLTKSTDGGATWSFITIDKSAAQQTCPTGYNCGWAYLGAQIVMTADTADNLYVLWNGGDVAGGPERVYFKKSTNKGATWTTRVDVSTAPATAYHAFPAIAATGTGDVRISWMDARSSHAGTPAWNTYYRRSTNGGNTWSAEVDISTYSPGQDTYRWPEGFRFPFGDYYEMDIDEQGTTHIVWGEGFSYDKPGSVWYSKGQ